MWSLLAAGLIGVACGDDDDSAGAVCGAGTILVDRQCVPDDAGDAGAGLANAGGDSAGRGGRDATAGSDATGGVSGSTIDGAGGMTTEAGAGGDAGLIGGADGAGGEPSGPVTPVPTRWLAFKAADGVFAYDVTKFPSSDALVQLGDSKLGSWSPDGRRLIYSDQSGWRVRDFSQAVPGPAVLLLDSAGSLQWSADSKSVSRQTGTELSVLNPDQAAPTLHPITSTLESYRWAPSGGKLAFVDASGGHVVDVVNGVPGVTVDVDAGTGWSPTGMALANVESDGSLTYTSLSGASPVVTTLFDAMTPDMGVEGFEFNREGSRVATYGWKDRAKPDTFFAQLLPTPGTLSTPYASLPATVSSVNIGWSPDGQWLLYETSDSADDTEQWFGVNVAGATPGTPIPFPVASLSSVHWLPDGHRFIADNQGSASLSIFDLLSPSTIEPLLGPVSTSGTKLNSLGTILAYRTSDALHLVDLTPSHAARVDITLTNSTNTVGSWGWSPDGKFIAAVMVASSDQLRLVRIDDFAASSPLDVGKLSSSSVNFAWQP
jgi:hypothetical protein